MHEDGAVSFYDVKVRYSLRDFWLVHRLRQNGLAKSTQVAKIEIAAVTTMAAATVDAAALAPTMNLSMTMLARTDATFPSTTRET